MSHLRAPAPRADRREGGRHGRPVARAVPSLPETHIRPQLMRLAVLPPLAVALSAIAAVLFITRSTEVRPSLALFAVLAGAVGVALGGIVIALVAADRAASSVHERIGALRRTSARGEVDLRALVDALRRGDAPPARKPRGGPAADADDFELLAGDLARAHDGAFTAVVQASQLSSQAGSEQKVEVFVNLARRLQSLVHREISILDELEHEIEDPDLLKGLFHVDHLATRIRRRAENLAVLGGAVSRRQSSNPVSMTEVLRSAIAEVEQYSRVKLVSPIDGTLRGHAVADVIHLLAELVENATVFSAPHTQVLLRANLVTSGLAVEVEDRGLGMPVEEQHKMNQLLTDPDQVNVASLLQDGRIGLFVVSQLARRHGIHVRLQTNIYGGVQAVLVVPQALLGADTEPGGSGGVPRPQPPAGPRQLPRPTRPGACGRCPSRPGSGRPPQDTRGGHRDRDARTRYAARRFDAAEAGAPRSAPPSPNGRPAPLPVRGARVERPNPAEAMPGISSDERRTVAENVAAPTAPRATAVRGTMGKPQLPRRRAQEHIAPQLRGGPAAPRPESDQLVGHDPGLMAAFQRGVGLAEARQLEPDYTDPALAAARYEAEYGETASQAPPEPTYAQPAYAEPTYTTPAGPQASSLEPVAMERVSVWPAGDGGRTDVAGSSMDSTDVPPPMDTSDTSHIAEAHRLRAPGHDLDLTARHDRERTGRMIARSTNPAPTFSAPADLRTPRSRSTMASDVPTGHVSDLDWLMSGLVQRVPHTTSAVLLSCDGLVKSVHGLDPDSADHMAALASGLYSLGRSAGVRFGDGGEVRQVVVELDSTLLFVTTAGSGTCLAVLRRPRGGCRGARLRDGDAGQERPPVPDDRAPAVRRRTLGDEALSVTAAGDGPWLDDAAGRLVRPYTVSNGRTRPTTALDLMSQVMSTGATPLGYLGPEHAQALDLCRVPVSVAEVAAHLKLPAAVTKVLLSDLVDCGALTTKPPEFYHNPTDRSLLEAVLDGLRRQL